MNIKTKFDIGDTVYSVRRGESTKEKFKVAGISIHVSYLKSVSIIYELYDRNWRTIHASEGLVLTEKEANAEEISEMERKIKEYKNDLEQLKEKKQLLCQQNTLSEE